LFDLRKIAESFGYQPCSGGLKRPDKKCTKRRDGHGRTIPLPRFSRFSSRKERHEDPKIHPQYGRICGLDKHVIGFNSYEVKPKMNFFAFFLKKC